MAKADTVFSLFGLESPQQVARRQLQEQLKLIESGQSTSERAGAALGTVLGRLFGGESVEMQQARQRQEAYDSVRGELAAERKQREAVYAEAMGMEGDQPPRNPGIQQIEQFNARADQLNALADRFASMGQPMDVVERIRTGAMKARMDAYTVSENLRKNRLAEDEIEMRMRKNQIELTQLENQGTGLEAIAQTLRERGREDLAQAVLSRVMTPKEALERSKARPEALSLQDVTGIPNNVLQNYSADSIKAATEVMLGGKQQGETDQAYSQRVVAALEKKPEKPKDPEKPQNFSEFLGIGETLLDSYSTSSRLAARKLFAEGKQENETDDQFRSRLLNALNVGLSKQQKERAAELSQSARVAIDGRPAFNKFWGSIDTAITGPLADDMIGLGKLINALGGDIAGIPESEYVNRLLSKETLNSAQFMKGALSDRDIEFLRDTVSRLGNTKESIKIAFAQLEANKLVDQIVYQAYMNEPDKANFNEAAVVREVQRDVYRRVAEKRGVDI